MSDGLCGVIEPAGEADASAAHLANLLSAEVAARPVPLVLDPSRLTFMDSWALTGLPACPGRRQIWVHWPVLSACAP